MLFSKIILCLLLNIYVNNRDKIKTFQGCMFICRNVEGVHVYLLKCWRGTCSSVGKLKGCIARERLGTPGLESGSARNNIHPNN